MTDTPASNSHDADKAASGGANGGGYRVLARKYRPKTFEELIGQDALVRTLTNAFESGRIAQGYMLTGVRGVGKTTTARLIARALNYSLSERPTVHMPEFGEHCEAILESRHVDVIEMDAASHTSVENIREIIEQVPYRPTSARYKVYIIDEVHMLSKAAFNALLKTLEEPPEHVKFIFATTEIRKVPVTILSRCQRFDLRRVPAEVLMTHLGKVCAQEGVTAEEAALRAIARAAEGSVRDALSLLDQAIAYGGETVRAEHVREMLGLADHGRVIDLFEKLMAGEAAGALASFAELSAIGAAPYQVLADLAAFTHLVTKMAIMGEQAADGGVSEEERARGAALARRLTVPVLARAWQMLLKGMSEVQAAAHPQMAAEMVLVRLAHVAEVPPPEELIRKLAQEEGTGTGASTPATGGPSPADGAPSAMGGVARPRASSTTDSTAASASAPYMAPASETRVEPCAPATAVPNSLRALAALAEERRDLRMAAAIREFLRPVSIEPGKLRIGLAEGAPTDLPRQLAARLREWTGIPWVVLREEDARAPTLAEQERREEDDLLRLAREEPAVREVLRHFPQARIVTVRPAPAAGAALAEKTGEDEEAK